MGAEPQPALLQRKALIKIGDETTAGTHSGSMVVFGANIYDVVCEPGDFFGEGEREPDGNYVGSVAAVLGKQEGKASWKFDVAPLGPLCGASSLGGQIMTLPGYKSDGGSPPAFKPSSSLALRVTKSLEVYQDGTKKIVDGGAGTVKLIVEDGKKLVAEVEVTGIWGGVTDVAMPAQAPIVAQPYVCRGITLTIASAAIAHVNKIEIDTGSTVEQRESVTAATGIAHYLVTEILPKITLDPEKRKVADQDQYGLFLAGATATLSAILTATLGTLTLSAPAVQRVKIGDSPRGKRQAMNLDLACRISSGDDALSISEAT